MFGNGGFPRLGGVAKVKAPVFFPVSGTRFYPTTNVTISCETAGAAIYYTRDGSDPTDASTLYTNTVPIALSATTTVKARAYKTDMAPSAVVSATYVYKAPAPKPAGFQKCVDITLATNLAATAITTGVPALVKLSEATISGFDYDDFSLANGGDMMFTDASGDPLPHEVDTWNVNGESLVWVKLPSTAVGTAITMYYGGNTAASADSADVWTGYTGVWHFDAATAACPPRPTPTETRSNTPTTPSAGHAEAFARNALGIATNETQTVFDELFRTNRTAVLNRPLDAFGRPAGLSLKIDGDFAQSVCYTYGTDGRMDTITITNAQGRTVSVGYDWNPIYERSERPSEGAAELAFFWGPDLSGTLQGAGGVGGLVAVSINGFFYFPGYDNNGNVVSYWDESGSLVAEYSYDAFGNTLSSSGSMASVFPHRFSTKYYDAETDLYYYGYRYYAPSLGRWISRDPIEEEGGLNLFLFCENSATLLSDILGHISIEIVSGEPQHFHIVETAKDIDVERRKIPSRGKSPFNDRVYVTMGMSSVRCIRIRPKILIRPDIRCLSEYVSGERFGSSGHIHLESPIGVVPRRDEQGMPDDYSDGGANTPYEMVYEHEVGHMEEALDWWTSSWKDDLESWIASNPSLFSSKSGAEQHVKDFLLSKQTEAVHVFYSNLQANVREHDYWRTMENSGQVKVLPTQLYDPPGENHKRLFLRVWEKK